MQSLPVTLPDGTPAVVRSIRRDGGHILAAALQQLSAESRYQRFLHPKTTFSSDELEYLTHCDGTNHIALVLAITDGEGREIAPVAVARCVRDPNSPLQAEVAVVVSDTWQRKGIGAILIQCLAQRAWEVGIRRWKGLHLKDNIAAQKLMERVGTQLSETPDSPGIVEVVYALTPPT